MRGSILYTALLLILFSACSNNKNSESQASENSSYNDNSSVYHVENVSDEDTVIMQGGFYVRVPKHPTKGISPSNAVMDDAEDAYEEGRALGEEDRHNHTRNHVGDNYNDDYEDDYDEGYSEEE